MAKKKESKNIEELLEEALIPKEEQPYEIPSNWEWVKLENICYNITDGTHQTPTYADTGVIFLSSRNVTSKMIDWDKIKYIPEELHLELSKRVSPKVGDILLAKNGTTGVAAIVDRDVVFDIYVSLALLRAKNEISKLYLLNFINSKVAKDQFNSRLKGIGVQNLHLKEIKEVKFPLPPLSEQTRIVNKLEALLSKLKEAKEKIAEAKNSFELRRASILHKAFTGELTAQWREEKAVNSEELTVNSLLEKINEEKLKTWEEECRKAEGEGKKKPSKPKLKSVEEMKISDDEKPYDLPQGWEWVRLGDVGEDFKYGYTDSAKENGDCKFLRITDIQDNQVNWDTVPYCDISLDKMQNYLLKKDDIVVARTGATTGKSFIIDKDELAVFASYLIRLRFICVLSKYTWYFMNANIYWNQITEVSSGIAQPGVNATKLSELLFPLPPLSEQQEIVARIEALLKAEEDAKELLNMEEQIDLLEKSILSKAFRGELGTNDPSDEPALELLKRVLGE